ncbi:acyl-ACP--UDP-N-acetylglucosamine O-acyltransferase [Methylonatrum kenyense]|uniref:acyl-ACP--UDP-N-acetylglucosamine O-acyltransferase n=1 Tax=Methylonatrum kenyense TaxID=455253 RepID=UPI0020BEB67D|nr:acyl-ACP--UDP-N-acetylglucosamine O-acyltransferase [Methylonatrum kenyense]MCK8516392.1 acyl-ACP--UDP-N-acetylglucosamine O-acyltransferase [Methylonatrum kenyense]
MPTIHETATVHPGAILGDSVIIAAGAVIGADVELGDGCSVGAHAVLEGPMQIGSNNRIGPHCVLGTPPQDRAYEGEPTRLEIGNDNVLREFVTIHRATTKENHVTRLGNDNYLMAYSHVGHDCVLGNHITMANAATLAGHVSVGDHVNIAGLCAVHQFARIGAYAMLGGGTMAPMDIPPYAMASGNHARLYGVNRRGLQRHGFEADIIRQIRTAYRLLFRDGLRLNEALAAIEANAGLQSQPIRDLLDFIRTSKRGITR